MDVIGSSKTSVIRLRRTGGAQVHAWRASCEVRDDERQDDEACDKRDEEREHNGHDDRERLGALALVRNLPEVRGFSCGRTYRVANKAFARWWVDSLLLHIARDRA
jgi:hypothetical protein